MTVPTAIVGKVGGRVTRGIGVIRGKGHRIDAALATMTVAGPLVEIDLCPSIVKLAKVINIRIS